MGIISIVRWNLRPVIFGVDILVSGEDSGCILGLLRGVLYSIGGAGDRNPAKG